VIGRKTVQSEVSATDNASQQIVIIVRHTRSESPNAIRIPARVAHRIRKFRSDTA
jgi:hypothetical protein